MKDGVFDAAHVLLHGQPAFHFIRVKRPFRVVRIGKTQEVPR